jgi:hypothetical protein
MASDLEVGHGGLLSARKVSMAWGWHRAAFANQLCVDFEPCKFMKLKEALI